MARPPADSIFRAPILRAGSSIPGNDDGTFERELLGFCVTAVLDQRVTLHPNETRTWWAERVGMSKSHVSKMVETPSVSFIDQFDLALTGMEPEPPVQPNSSVGRRLRPLLSNFYAEQRPSEWRGQSRSVLNWFARYQPDVSPQLKDVLFRSEIALEKCAMLEKSGLAEYDEDVRISIRELLVVVSGPYGASMIAHQQAAELGLMVPSVFFDAIEETLFRSPLGFRVLRTLDRFVKLWRGQGPDPNAQRRQAIDKRLTLLLRRLAQVAFRFPFIDPYPGSEWATSLARDCLTVHGDVSVHAYRSLARTFKDVDSAGRPRLSSDRARLYAAWVVADQAPGERREAALAALSSRSSSPYLRKWAGLMAQIVGSTTTEAADDMASSVDTLVHNAFSDEYESVRKAIAAQTLASEYDGIRNALQSAMFSALVTPDGSLRRALIEGVTHADLVEPAAAALDTMLCVDQNGSGRPLRDEGLRETAIFLLGRLRQPSPERIEFLLSTAQNDPDDNIARAALWCLGDIWRSGSPAKDTVKELRQLPSDPARPPATRIAAAHVLAIIAHQEVHQEEPTDFASKALARVAADREPTDPAATVVRAIAKWGQGFDPTRELDPKHVLLLDDLFERNVPDQDNLALEPDAVGV